MTRSIARQVDPAYASRPELLCPAPHPRSTGRWAPLHAGRIAPTERNPSEERRPGAGGSRGLAGAEHVESTRDGSRAVDDQPTGRRRRSRPRGEGREADRSALPADRDPPACARCIAGGGGGGAPRSILGDARDALSPPEGARGRGFGRYASELGLDVGRFGNDRSSEVVSTGSSETSGAGSNLARCVALRRCSSTASCISAASTRRRCWRW